jgi:hypothetical protein
MGSSWEAHVVVTVSSTHAAWNRETREFPFLLKSSRTGALQPDEASEVISSIGLVENGEVSAHWQLLGLLQLTSR